MMLSSSIFYLWSLYLLSNAWVTNVLSQDTDCPDGYYKCSTLNDTFEIAANYSCISSDLLCDYNNYDSDFGGHFPIPDCPLGDDEWNCDYCFIETDPFAENATGYICPSTGTCIPYMWSCAASDQIVDCHPNHEDRSQEVCEETNENYVDCLDSNNGEYIDGDFCFGDDSYPGINQCFKCNDTNGECIRKELLCDGYDHCVDGQDETTPVCPTFAPTKVPSIMPSTMPSSIPSYQPSDIPSYQPSNIPSNEPSDIPSESPQNVPTQAPIKVPSTMPSIIPSNEPTNEPVKPPTMLPSSEPSIMPSNMPSDIPTGQPTQPTNEPSLLPSEMPTLLPPTFEPTKGLTEGQCCHAREDTDLYEDYCNDITNKYIRDCVSRKNQIRCRWEIESRDTECPIIGGSEIKTKENSENVCQCEGTSRYSYGPSCNSYIEMSKCLYAGCQYNCPQS